ncbi:MAG: hypothetical protein KJ858_02130, partial [Nanoarchaeota archaeon]|nr:hypothetical protein [Nanoarchaeota archaeon]
MNIDIESVLDNLKFNKSDKTKLSLDKLNDTLKAYYRAGNKDYSITTIGKISKKDGGVGYDSIRKTSNNHFRELIQAYAALAETTTKKPPKFQAKTGHDYELLTRINDVALRAVFGQIIRERDRYKRESDMLKNQTEIIIDKRTHKYTKQADDEVQVLHSLKGICSHGEIEALKCACSEQFLTKNEWKATDLGQIKD